MTHNIPTMIYKNREEGFMRLRGVSLVCWQNKYYLSPKRGVRMLLDFVWEVPSSCLVSEGWKRYLNSDIFFLPWYLSSPKKSLLQACCLEIGPRLDGLRVEDLGRWDPGIMVFFSKDPHGWKFSFTVVFPTNRFFQWCHVDDLECTPPETLPLNSTNVFWHCKFSRSKSVLQPGLPCLTVDANTFTASDISPKCGDFCWMVLLSPIIFHKFCQKCHGFKLSSTSSGWFG